MFEARIAASIGTADRPGRRWLAVTLWVLRQMPNVEIVRYSATHAAQLIVVVSADTLVELNLRVIDILTGLEAVATDCRIRADQRLGTVVKVSDRTTINGRVMV